MAGLVAALQQMSLQGDTWVMDTSASTHMHSSEGILLSRLPTADSSILVGNGARITVTTRGFSILDTNSAKFILNNILVAPSLVRNLLSIRQFTRDNGGSIEFDAFGFSVKDPSSKHVMLRCNRASNLYTIPPAAISTTPHAALAVSFNMWHLYLCHPDPATINTLRNNSSIFCNKGSHTLCHSSIRQTCAVTFLFFYFPQ